MDLLKELQPIAQERDIPLDVLKEELEQALAIAFKKYKGVIGEVTVRLDPSKKSGAVLLKEVVGVVVEPAFQVSLEKAQKSDPKAEIGDFVPEEIDTETFGRIAASTFKQVLQQRLRETETRLVNEELKGRVDQVVTAVVSRREENAVLLTVNKVEVEMPKREQVTTDHYRPNAQMKVVVLEVRSTTRGTRAVVSRSHPKLVLGLLELEVPEIGDNLVEVINVVRDPGQRSKVAVKSLDERIDAVGTCVGQCGARIQAVMDELDPEKIDIVQYSDNPRVYITNALTPAKVIGIELEGEGKERRARVIVPASQHSLAIGRGGQNVRLAARLTGWHIDIHSEGQSERDRPR